MDKNRLVDVFIAARDLVGNTFQPKENGEYCVTKESWNKLADAINLIIESKGND